MPKMPSIPKMPGIGIKPTPAAPVAPVAPAAAAQTPTSAPETPQEETNRPFTADQLRDAWVGLAQTHTEELRLKQLMEAYSPVLKDELTAQITMPNPWQMKEMRKALPALVRQLHRLLHNNQLQIELVQAEYSQEQMAFTSEEKFAVMAEQNPVVNILKERLDLTID